MGIEATSAQNAVRHFGANATRYRREHIKPQMLLCCCSERPPEVEDVSILPVQQVASSTRPEDIAAEGSFEVTLVKGEEARVGMNVVRSRRNPRYLRVTQIREGIVQNWNADNPARQIMLEDRILSVNGERSSERMLYILKEEDTLTLELQRGEEA